MMENDIELLEKLGINVIEVTEPMPKDNADISMRGKFYIDDSKFIPMCRLVKIVDMICESKNPQINEQFNHLVTMLFLTEDKKNG